MHWIVYTVEWDLHLSAEVAWQEQTYSKKPGGERCSQEVRGQRFHSLKEPNPIQEEQEFALAGVC